MENHTQARRLASLGGSAAIILLMLQHLLSIEEASAVHYAGTALVAGPAFVALVSSYLSLVLARRPRAAGVLEATSVGIMFLLVGLFIVFAADMGKAVLGRLF